MLVLYVFSQVSVGDLQILPHLAAVVEEGQVAILDTDQLREEVKSSDSDGELASEHGPLTEGPVPVQEWEVDSPSTKIRFKTFSSSTAPVLRYLGN